MNEQELKAQGERALEELRRLFPGTDLSYSAVFDPNDPVDVDLVLVVQFHTGINLV